MAGDSASEMQHFKTLGRSAFVLGYTGEVGKALVAELNKTKAFKKVVLIGRRVVSLNVGPEFEQKVVDFEKLDDHKDVFEGIDAGFCCLGTYRAKVGVQNAIRIDRDYVLMSAQIAKDKGCKHFSIVTSMGSNKDSFFSYPKTKGEAEDGLQKMNFDRLSIFRPGFLICEREEHRLSEQVVKVLMKPMIYFMPTLLSVPVETVAKAMLQNAVRSPSSSAPEIYENKAIHQMGKDSQ